MSRTGFLTATGVLFIAFFVWGALWMLTAELYVGNEAGTWSVGYGLIWVFVGAMLSLLAMLSTLFFTLLTRPAIVMLGSAATLAVIKLLALLVAVLWKIAMTGQLWEPIFAEPSGFPSGFVAFGLLIFVPIIVFVAWWACVSWIESTMSFFDDLIGSQY